MNKFSKIYIAGHNGMVGSAILKKLEEQGYSNIIGKTHSELDLTNQSEVDKFFELERPEYVILAAARVGGIKANITFPADFITENLLIQCNVIKSSHKYNVKKLLFLGSSCIYPKDAPQPLKEEYLLSGYLEPTNEGYALAKIAGLKMCEYYKRQYGVNYISMMPCNLYGKNDNFNVESSHVVPSLIRRIHEAKVNNSPSVVIWGSGKQYREFMYVEDMADAAVYLLENYNETEFINVGTGTDVTIRELAETIKKIVGFEGELVFDTTKPDGMFRKVLDVNRLSSFGWKYKTSLEQGIKETYEWFKESVK